MMAPRTTTPPTTPPAMAPTGVDLPFESFLPLVWSKPGPKLEMDVTRSDAMTEAEVKDTVTGAIEDLDVPVADDTELPVLVVDADTSTWTVRETVLSCSKEHIPASGVFM